MGLFDKLFSSKTPPEDTKLGRNDICWCGSGKKYKRCHSDSDAKKKSGKIAEAAARKRR